MTRIVHLPSALRRPIRLVLIVFMALSTGCTLVRRTPLPLDRSQDGRIRSEIEARIAAEPVLSANQIRVEVDGRIVVLHGSVEGIGAWQCAIRNANLVDGVQSVADFLVIERGERDVPCVARRNLVGQ